MDQDSDIHLRWNNHQTTLLSVFSSLLGCENLVDCTISAEGQYFKAHRVILSACSPYFEALFSEHCETHPIVILPDVKFDIMKALMEFMYSGEVKVPQNKLCTVLELADTLQIKGLADLRTKKRNESPIHCDEQGFREHLHEHWYSSQFNQKEDVSSSHTSEKKCSQDIDSLLLAAQKCDKSSSKSISPEKAVEEAVMSQDITDSEAFKELQCSSPTKTLTESNTHVSGTLLNQVFNILDSSQLPGPSKEAVGEQRILSENVLLTCSTSEEVEPLMNGESPAAHLVPEIKLEAPDDFRGNNVEEIVVDDDNDDSDNDSGEDNSGTVGGSVIPEESISGQGFCSLEQYRDTYFVEPPSVEPKPFKCETCGKSYRYQRGLWRHLKFECGKGPQFSCPQCPSRFSQKWRLKIHFQRTHLPY